MQMLVPDHEELTCHAKEFSLYPLEQRTIKNF